jgi:predicted ATPase
VLGEHLAAAGRGEGRIVLIAGEPGIGKTRLLAEIATRAQAAGWHVLRGCAYESEGLPPFLPFIEALRPYVRSAPIEALRAQLGAGAADIAQLVPAILERLPELPAPRSVAPE